MTTTTATKPNEYVLLNMGSHIANHDSDGNVLFKSTFDVPLLVPSHLRDELAAVVEDGSKLWAFVEGNTYPHYDDESVLPYTIIETMRGMVHQYLVNSKTVSFS